MKKYAKVPRRVPMDRLESIYKKITESKKTIPGAVSVLCVCLVAVMILFFCLPETKAAVERSVTWTTTGNNVYKLSDLTNGDNNTVIKTEVSVTDNDALTPYVIDGTGVTGLNQSININYTGGRGTADNPTKVYVTLKNINIQRNLDYEIISFTTSSGAVQFIVTVEGEGNIESISTGTEYRALIAIENISYDVLMLTQASVPNPTSVDDYVVGTSVERRVGLVLGGSDPDATLRLASKSGCFGAAIGSRESATLNEENSQTATSVIDSLTTELRNNSGNQRVYVNDSDISDEIYNMGFTKIADGEFYIGYVYQQRYTAGAGEVIIGGLNGQSPLRLSILNEGYGAAIGGGAGSATASSASNAAKITINNGSIHIHSTREDVAAIGTGVALKTGAAPATVEGIEINGGSIQIETRGQKFTKNPVNAAGKRVYEIEAGTGENADGLKISNLNNLAAGVEIPITYYPRQGLQFDENISNFTDSVTKLHTIDVDTQYVYLDVMVAENTIGYKYQGCGYSDSNSLYFYLPATETTTLTIKDEFGVGYGDDYAKYIVKDSQGRVIEPVSDDVTSPSNRVYVLIKGETYYLNATYIPNGLSIKDVLLTVNTAITSANFVNNYGGYGIPTTSASITADVIYGGTIDIVYDDGFIVGDEANHNVTLPSMDYEYGTEVMNLANLGTIMKTGIAGTSVPDLIFEGWMYTDPSGAEKGWVTHITSAPKSGGTSDHYEVYSDLIQSDGKIYLKAKWKIKIEYTVNHGDEPREILLNYGEYDPYYTYDVTITDYMPAHPMDDYSFDGWLLDADEDTIYRYGTDIDGTATVSTLTSHIFHANFVKSGFAVYIDAAALSEKYAILQCLRGIEQLLIKNPDGTLATTVKDGKAYYYTRPLPDSTPVRVIMETASGYKMSNLSVVCSTANTVSTDDATGECFIDFAIKGEDVYISTQAKFSAIEYDIFFKDGKEPSEYLWNGFSFTYDIEDVESGKTIGDIIREGLGKANMSDKDIANAVNTIDKNNRFTDFAGWTLNFVNGVINTDAVLADVIGNSGTVTYGTLTFSASWMEYDKFAINVTLLERQFMENGTFKDIASGKIVPVLYYYTDGGSMYPVYTETVIDKETGEETTTAYAKAGDKINIVLFRANSKGNPLGDPLTDGIKVEELYYTYESKLDETVRADVQGSLYAFTVKDDVKDDTIIEVYMVFSPKQYTITYWDLRGFDNSSNPIKYTIFDDFDFVPLTKDVQWLLVRQDNDESNDDDVTTEVIYGIDTGGKLVSDGAASNRNYVSNLILKPDWTDYKEEMYTIDIVIDGQVFGEIIVSHPWESDAYRANETIVLNVKPMEGYQLVPGSLTYKRADAAVPLSLKKAMLGKNSLSLKTEELPLTPVYVSDGVYVLTMPSSDIIINAMFEICEYTITYSDMTADIINPNPESYTINSSIVLEDATKEGYNFLGWYDEDGNRILKISNRTGNLVLTPMFQLIEEEPDDPVVKPPGEESGDTPSDNPSDNPADKPSDDSTNNPVDKPDNGNDGNDKDDTGGITDGTDNKGEANKQPNNDKNERPNISGRPSNVIINGSSTQSGKTGDTADVPRLILISVAAMLVLMIVVLKSKENKEDVEKV